MDILRQNLISNLAEGVLPKSSAMDLLIASLEKLRASK